MQKLVAIASADAGAVDSAFGFDRAAGDIDIGFGVFIRCVSSAFLRRVAFQGSGAVSDAGRPGAAFRGNGTIGNSQLGKTHVSRADAGSALVIGAAVAVPPGRVNGSAVDHDPCVTGVSAADAGAEPDPFRRNLAAVDHNIRVVIAWSFCQVGFLFLGTDSAADAGAAASASGRVDRTAVNGNPVAVNMVSAADAGAAAVAGRGNVAAVDGDGSPFRKL